MVDASNITDLAVTQATAPRAFSKTPASNATLDKTAKDFESMFVTQMLQPMFDGISVDPVFGGGHGEEVMRSFMLQEYGKQIASSGAIGLSSSIKSAMIQEQQAAQNGGSHGIIH